MTASCSLSIVARTAPAICCSVGRPPVAGQGEVIFSNLTSKSSFLFVQSHLAFLSATAYTAGQNSIPIEGEGDMAPDKLKILFLCTGNSCRSQMAEAWARHLKSDVIEAYSAGTAPQRARPEGGPGHGRKGD